MKFSNYTFVFVLFLFFFITQISSAQDVKPLFENELKFCKTLTETGFSNAFLQFIAEDGIMFLPTPANGKNYYEKNKNESKNLIWEAEFAEISSGNDFGYTTGPWHSTKESKTGKPVTTYGHFNTVWQKINGEWKFLIDCGISYDEAAITKTQAGETVLKPVPAPVLKRERFPFEALIEIDNSFNTIALDNNINAAYEKYASENIRVYRDKKYPVAGFQNAKELLKNKKMFYTHMGGKSSQAGDFAFTYGTAGKTTEKPEFDYMRIWKKEGSDWKIVLDVMTGLK